MDLLSLFAIAIVTFATFAAIIYKKHSIASKEEYQLPPGPPAKRFWSNAMPAANSGTTFNDWANEYGPVITLRCGSKITVIIARVDAAAEIMEKEGGALVDRPPVIAAGELLSGGKRLLLVGAGERFRRLRKVVHMHFQIKAVESYKYIQLEQARALILDILDNPKNFRKHTHRFSTSVVLRITYGNSRSTSVDDPEFVGVKQIIQHFIEAMRPGAYLVDRFRWLKYVPGYGMRLKAHYKSDLMFYRGMTTELTMWWETDSTSRSFSETLLENTHEHKLSFDEMSFLAGALYEAESDTTANAVTVMIMAAARFPDAQSRVHDELDAIVGMDRLPSWADWSDLPQLHAFISESLRWRPVTPVGREPPLSNSCADFPLVFRIAQQEISSEYDAFFSRGYCIPAGATVIGNQWTISRDPEVFPDPEKFDPQRWVDEQGRLRKDVECYSFGFGRRICPGMHLANRSMFIALAVLLWSFRIRERPESPIDTTPDTDNAVAHLAPFDGM